MKKNHSSKEEEYLKIVVLNVLQEGKENALKVKDVSNLTGINGRDIRYIVNRLRKDGIPIVSTTYDGYWVTNNPSELNITIKQLIAQKKTLQDTIESLIIARNKIIGE